MLSALHDRAGFTSAQELHEALEADDVTIGLTTVYRTLHTLDRLGQVDVVRERTGERLTDPAPGTDTATTWSAATAASAPPSRRTRWNAGRKTWPAARDSPRSSTPWS
ncbi:hypothetical protein GCM10010279_30590 [Streptomyces mutabilis]|nr:hypothetical protein GCM10010279_30590 [Streptomyces mutabilis]